MSSRVLIWFSVFIPISYALQVQHNTFHSRKKNKAVISTLCQCLNQMHEIPTCLSRPCKNGGNAIFWKPFIPVLLYLYHNSISGHFFFLCYSIWYCIQFPFGLTYRIQSNKKACECNVFSIVLYVLKWF